MPMDFKQVDWWDKREGALPDPAVSYPELPKAAAFICTGSTCSSPIFDPARIAPFKSPPPRIDQQGLPRRTDDQRRLPALHIDKEDLERPGERRKRRG